MWHTSGRCGVVVAVCDRVFRPLLSSRPPAWAVFRRLVRGGGVGQPITAHSRVLIAVAADWPRASPCRHSGRARRSRRGSYTRWWSTLRWRRSSSDAVLVVVVEATSSSRRHRRHWWSCRRCPTGPWWCRRRRRSAYRARLSWWRRRGTSRGRACRVPSHRERMSSGRATRGCRGRWRRWGWRAGSSARSGAGT